MTPIYTQPPQPPRGVLFYSMWLAIELVSQRTMTHPHQPVVNGLIYGDGDAPLHDVLLLMFTMHSATGNICSHRQMPDLYTPAGATSKAIRC